MNKTLFRSVFGILTVLVSATAGSLVAQTTAPVPPTQAAGAEMNLLLAGLEEALAGDFQEAQQKLSSGTGQATRPSGLLDPVAAMLADYMKVSERWRLRRANEFEINAARVRNCLLANEHLAELTAQGLHKTVRENMKGIRQGFQEWPSAEQFSEAWDEDLESLQKKALDAARSQSEAIAKLSAVFAGQDGPYAKTLLSLAEQTQVCVNAYDKAWAQAQVRQVDERRASAAAIRNAEDDLLDAIASLDAFTSDQPLRSALPYARLAKLISFDPNDMSQYTWYGELISRVKQRAQEAAQEGKWYEALASYNGLAELEDGNEEYRMQAKVARRHVRVLGLYANGEDDADEAAEVKDDAADTPEEMRWTDMVRGIDADIVHRVIAQLDEQYVQAVDYRKLSQGALECIRVLATTERASASFPKLADKQAREKFVAAIDREADNIRRKDRVDYTDLTILLNTLLRESQRSVEIPVSVMAMEFTDGFLDELDRFSSMIWPADLDDFTKQTMGEFYGVGIQIGKEENEPLKVITPLANSPALHAGIKTGDMILKVDGVPTDTIAVDKLVRMITGPRGTKVTLTVRPRGEKEPREVVLVRDEIQIRTVKGWKLLPGGNGDNWDFMLDKDAGIAYIRIIQFTDTTPRDLASALEKLKRNGVNSLIVDLRYNPGGLLEASRLVADEFVTGGRIVSTKGRQNRGRTYDATPSGAYTDGDLVVLVNEMSASAAEILSGAMRDWNRAIVVGQRTFGKGSVQNVIQIPRHPNARLKLTTAYYYLPSGRLLHRKDGEKDWGVDPHVEVVMTPREQKNWLDLRRKTDLLMDVDVEELDKDLADEYKADLPLNTAVLLLKLKQIQANSIAAVARAGNN